MERKKYIGQYHLETIDNGIDTNLQGTVYEYLINSEWNVNFYDPCHSLYYPKNDQYVTPRNYPASPRLPIAWDDLSLEHRCPIIYELWKQINSLFENRFIIQGSQEGMPNYMTGISPLPSLTKADGTPGISNCGWRVYGSAYERELKARSKAIHRDSPELNDESQFGIIYFANRKWFSQYYGETLFYSNFDPLTNDNTSQFTPDQQRNFTIGDVENVVSPRPGRICLYDLRYLHQIKPTSDFADEILLGIVFRVKLK